MTRYNRLWFFGPGGTNFTKYSTQNKPTESMFKKLFGSIAFLKERDDTATTSAQGLAKIATDVNVQTLNSTIDADGFTKVVQPHQLPYVTTENQYTLGSSANALAMVVEYNDRYRTGGDGNTYVLKNTMEITSNSPIVTVAQANEGEDAELDVSASALNTAIENSQAFITLENKVDTSIATVITGKIGEIKMYSFYNERLGDTNCEFDIIGIGRDTAIEGATGQWAGWVVLQGQLVADLVAAGADASILARYTNRANIVDTREKYPSGVNLGATDVTARSGFGEVGENKHALTVGETPVKEHSHDLGALASGTASGDGAHLHKIMKPTTGNNIAPMFELKTSADLDFYIYTGEWNGSIDGDGTNPLNYTADGTHRHSVSISGTTETKEDIIATEHENRPSTFMTCFVVYLGTTGSQN